MSNLKQTNTTQFLTDLTGGAFADQIGMAISDVAESVIATGKKGQVKITLDLSVLGDKEAYQVNVKHKLDYTAPETFGTRKEDYARQTPMYVNKGGEVSLFANHTAGLFDNINAETDA